MVLLKRRIFWCQNSMILMIRIHVTVFTFSHFIYDKYYFACLFTMIACLFTHHFTCLFMITYFFDIILHVYLSLQYYFKFISLWYSHLYIISFYIIFVILYNRTYIELSNERMSYMFNLFKMQWNLYVFVNQLSYTGAEILMNGTPNSYN